MKIIELATRRRVTIAMFTISILLFGMVSLSRLKTNLLPDLSYPTITVRTELEGAAPGEIENLITRPIEEVVGIVKNLGEIRSVSQPGQSDVILQFAWGADMDRARVDVREKLDALFLPEEASRPILLRFDPSLDPVMRFGLFRSEVDLLNIADADVDNPMVPVSTTDVFEASIEEAPYNEEELKSMRRYAEQQVKKALESADGVASAKISGGLEDEIQVWIDQDRLAQLNLTVAEISNVLGSENINQSAGRLEEGTQQFLVRTLNQFQEVTEIRDVIVAQRNNQPVYLRDVATITQGFKEREAITRINGREAVEIAIYKEGDANTVAVAESIRERMEFINEQMPAEYEMKEVYDQSVFIKQAVDGVINAGIIGGLLAIAVIFFFLRSVWPTIIIGVSIPVSVIATFNMMNSADLSLNIMSLGGLALGIGLLVDNSIVVLENIARYKKEGLSGIEAAKKGAGEVGMAVVASTLTTVAVFLPLVFVDGIAGQLFRDQALTVTFALLASLIVALTLIPMMSSLTGQSKIQEVEPIAASTKFGRKYKSRRRFVTNAIPAFFVRMFSIAFGFIGKVFSIILMPIQFVFDKILGSLDKIYPATLKSAMNHKTPIVVLSLALFGWSVWLVPQLGIELIPQLSQGEFNVSFDLPPGTPIEKTDEVMRRIQTQAADHDNVKVTFAVAGTGNRLDANPDQGGDNRGVLSVTMDNGFTPADELLVMSDLRSDLGSEAGINYKFARPSLFTFSTPIEIVIAGYDLQDLRRIGNNLKEKLEASDRFADIKSTMETGHPEIQILFDRERAAALGLAVHDVADRVVNKVRGNVATRYLMQDRKIDIRVRAREEDRASAAQLRQLIVNPQSERPVPLSAIADIQIANGPSEIRRISQERVAIVSANLSYGDMGAAGVEINSIIRNLDMPAGITARLAGQSEEMQSSFDSLILALLLAIFLVYLVMASQFESLIHPFVILFTIPLAGIGAVFALWITGSTISIVVFIGFLLLAGIVVNNAIVLIDRINQLREEGMERAEAIIEAGKSRLRPILMTTLTTTLGLLPLAIGLGEGAELRAPMAITVIGGLVVSTLLTLVVIPVVYAILDRKNFDAPASSDTTEISPTVQPAA